MAACTLARSSGRTKMLCLRSSGRCGSFAIVYGLLPPSERASSDMFSTSMLRIEAIILASSRMELHLMAHFALSFGAGS